MEFRKERSKEDEVSLEKRRAQGRKRKYSESFVKYGACETESEEEVEEEDDEEELDEEQMTEEDWG